MATYSFRSRLTNYIVGGIGIDLGTVNSLVFVRGRGVVLNQPSFVAFRQGTNAKALVSDREMIAIGEAAKEMVGRTPKGVEVIAPIQEGVITNFGVTQVLLDNLVRTSYGKDRLFRSYGIICIPALASEIEKRALEEVAELSNLSRVYFMEEVMAAALGAGINVMSPRGSMIVDIGGGTTDVATIALGGVVCSRSSRTAGNVLDECVMSYIKQVHNLNVGTQSAERAKIAIGNTRPGKAKQFTVCGSDLRNGAPMEVALSDHEILEAIQGPIEEIISMMRKVLESTPPELLSDIIASGVTLVGGGALLRGLDRTLSEETGVPVLVAEDPLCCAVQGVGEVLQDFENYEQLLERP